MTGNFGLNTTVDAVNTLSEPVQSRSGTTDVCIETTPVTLSYFKTTPEGDGVRIEWSTATETGNLGFKLFAAAH